MVISVGSTLTFRFFSYVFAALALSSTAPTMRNPAFLKPKPVPPAPENKSKTVSRRLRFLGAGFFRVKGDEVDRDTG